MRLKNQRYGRTKETISGGSSTHIVKVGFDNRKPDGTYPVPGRFNGFVICRDRVGPDNNLIVDHAIMRRLDPKWSEAKLAQAKAQQLKAADDLLPKTLHFVLIGNAVNDDDGEWHYPRTFSQSLEWWGKDGLCCIGNGYKALRTQDNRTKKEMDCIPVGRPGFDPADYCPHSVTKMVKNRNGKDQPVIDCKSHSRLMLSLYVIGPDGKPEPLCRELGWNGRFRFDTASGYNPLRILSELDEAAKRCEGEIHLIRGTLSFGLQRKRYDGGVSVVGQVMFSLSEEDIARREQEIHRRKMEREGRVLTAEPGRVMIGMEVPTETPINPDEELAAAAGMAEMSDPPWPSGGDNENIEDGDDIPFGDDGDLSEEPEDAAVEIRVADASPEQLLDALVRLCNAAAKEEGAQFIDVFRRVATIETSRGPHVPSSPGWFLASSGQQAEVRVNALRQICQEFEENGDQRFVINPQSKAAVPA